MTTANDTQNGYNQYLDDRYVAECRDAGGFRQLFLEELRKRLQKEYETKRAAHRLMYNIPEFKLKLTMKK